MKSSAQLKPSLLLLTLTCGLAQISETIYSPALPNITHYLATSNALVQWTLSIYFIGFALGVFIWGRLSDHIGRRPVMLMGLMIYALCCIFCAMSKSIEWLLMARLIQGFGISVGSVITLTMSREAFDGHERNKVFASISAALAFAPALGPFIGGYLVQLFAWQSNFTFLFLMSAVVLGLAVYRLPETKPQQTLKPESVIHVLKHMLCDYKVIGAVLLIGLVNGLLFSYYAEAPFIFINTLGLKPAHFGWLGVLIASGAFIGSMLSKKLCHTYQAKQLALLGSLIMVVCALLMLLVIYLHWVTPAHKGLSVALMMLPMSGLILGGLGMVVPATLSTALKDYHDVLGTAGALFGLGYYIIVALVTAGMGLLHSTSLLTMPLYFAGISFFMCGISWLMLHFEK